MNKDDSNGVVDCDNDCQLMMLDRLDRLTELERGNQNMLMDAVSMKTDVGRIASILGQMQKDNLTTTRALLDDKKTWGRIFMASFLLGAISLMIVTVATLNTHFAIQGGGASASFGHNNQ